MSNMNTTSREDKTTFGKEEILSQLVASKQISKFKPTELWKMAFAFYIAVTGDKSVTMNCTSCYKSVLRWLKD